jgi:glucosamine--fructose-6-phosphate aminotransferase (isomerizing)
VTVTTVPDSSLAQRADVVLAAPDAREESMVQTRSFTSMFLLAQAFASRLAGEHGTVEALRTLPDTLSSLIERVGDLPREIGADLSLQRFFFLGGGPLYGLAGEAMLKTKEMTLSWSEAYHPLEFRHGPMSVVNDATLVVGFVSDSGLAAERQVLRDMQALGARTLVLTEDTSPFEGSGANYVVELRSGHDTWKRAVLYLPLIQWIAYHRALAKGLDPDHPTNLKAVIEL